MHDVMTAKQAAEFLQTSRDTVIRKARAGILPAAKLGREWRFRRTELETWLAEGGERYEALVDEGLALAMDEAAEDPANKERIPWEQVKAKHGL